MIIANIHLHHLDMTFKGTFNGKNQSPRIAVTLVSFSVKVLDCFRRFPMTIL